jgi:hypothetical protein
LWWGVDNRLLLLLQRLLLLLQSLYLLHGMLHERLMLSLVALVRLLGGGGDGGDHSSMECYKGSLVLRP